MNTRDIMKNQIHQDHFILLTSLNLVMLEEALYTEFIILFNTLSILMSLPTTSLITLFT